MVTKDTDFTAEDRMDMTSYNRILWVGLMGNKPYPAIKGLTQDEDDD